MRRWLFILVAVLCIWMVVAIAIAPDVDLPDTVLGTGIALSLLCVALRWVPVSAQCLYARWRTVPRQVFLPTGAGENATLQAWRC